MSGRVRHSRDAVAIASEFWQRMGENDWQAAAELFADDFELVWPQSGERIVSREAFVSVNAEGPAAGRWTFATTSLFGRDDHAVSETEVSDTAIKAVALTFFETDGERIRRMREFWPDPFPAPEWRRAFVSTSD